MIRALAPHAICPPRSAPSPLIVEIPHAGLALDAEALATLVAPASSIARDADTFVDELYEDAPDEGATVLRATVSRYLVDLNRAEHDVDALSVRGAPDGPRAPRGVLWRVTSDGGPVLAHPLDRSELERRLDLYYRPYHAALAALVEEARQRFGYAVVLAAHSMPSIARSAGERAIPRADVVPGTRGRTSAATALIDALDGCLRAEGVSVAHDEPYKGGFTTQHYGRPSHGVHVIQVELARRLYMDEATLRRGPGFEATRALCRRMVATLSRFVPSRAAGAR